MLTYAHSHQEVIETIDTCGRAKTVSEESLGSQLCPFSITNFEHGEPWADYEALLKQSPIHWDAKLDGWAVLDFEICSDIEIDEGKYGIPFPNPASQTIIDIKGGRGISVLSGDEHRMRRKFFMTLFTPQNVKSYTEHHIVPVLNFLMDRMLSKGTGRAELTKEFGDQVPPRVIAALLGIQWKNDELVQRIHDLHDELMMIMGDGFRSEALLKRGLVVSKEINDMLLPFIRERRDNPQNDLISRLWIEAPKYLGDVLETDVLSMARDLFIAGADTTVHGIANVLYLVLTNPDIREAVEARRDEVFSIAVEEAMRLFGSVMYRYRMANQDCELGGQKIAKGDLLILFHSAANRDPSKYSCPHSADLTRKRASDHLAFNKGPRRCVGSGLAIAEMVEALRIVLDRMPNVRLDPDTEPPAFDGLFIRSWRPLNVVFD